MLSANTLLSMHKYKQLKQNSQKSAKLIMFVKSLSYDGEKKIKTKNERKREREREREK